MGCKPIEPIEFVEIKNVKVNSLQNNKLKISADIILNNPNKVKIIISKVDVGVYAESVLLVKIDEENERELSNMSESTIDIQGDIDVKNLESFINEKGLSLLFGNEKVSLKFKGEIEAKAYGIKDIILIDYLNICASSRYRGNSTVNSYSYIKAIAEELRGLAVEANVPIVSATQTTRSGFGSSDVELTDTSESFGLPATADLMFALISTDDLE